MQYLEKTSSGITGLDEITNGGLPKGRPTLVCGKAGCGKTLMALEFIVNGAQQFDEPGVFISFEESEQELATNVSSFGWDIEKLVSEKKIALDYIFIEPNRVVESGDFDLEGLMLRIESAIDEIDAKRIAIDSIEVLFGSFTNQNIIRGELRRLFRWLKSKDLTVVITGEKSGNDLTRSGIEEFVSDCVLYLKHEVDDLIATRHMQIVKYRGSSHGSNFYPFLITDSGISILPVTSVSLDYEVSNEFITTGVEELDKMFGGKGFYRDSSILVSGTSGTGKTSIASIIVDKACNRGERVIFYSFEESEKQIIRNMLSIGIDFEKHINNGALKFINTRVSSAGIEAHLIKIFDSIEKFRPDFVVFDPISNMVNIATIDAVKSMLTRIVDYLKTNKITSIMTNLSKSYSLEDSENEISSLIDTWILLRDIESGSERNKGLYLLKSRGLPHSNQIREYKLSDNGIIMMPVYEGPEGVLTGTARLAQEERELLFERQEEQEVEKFKKELMAKKESFEAKIKALKSEFETETYDLQQKIDNRVNEKNIRRVNRERMIEIRS